MRQLGNFVKDDVAYTLSPLDADQSALREPAAGDDVIIGGDLYRVAAVDSRLKFTFDTTAGEPEMWQSAAFFTGRQHTLHADALYPV